MAPRSCYVVHLFVYRNHRCLHEQVCVQIHAVSVLAVKLVRKLSSPFNTRLSLKHVAEAGSLAEEVISTIRTAQAFGTQKTLSGLYDKNIDISRAIDSKTSVSQGASLGCVFFVVYSAYALAFDFGTTLINEGYG